MTNNEAIDAINHVIDIYEVGDRNPKATVEKSDAGEGLSGDRQGLVPARPTVSRHVSPPSADHPVRLGGLNLTSGGR